VVLAWPYKDCVLEGGQTKEDQKRDEVFWNEILAPDEIDRLLAPKVLTNWRRYDAVGRIANPAEVGRTGSPTDAGRVGEPTEVGRIANPAYDFDTDKLIIKGNNLLALHSLKRRYAGKVKLIYCPIVFSSCNTLAGVGKRAPFWRGCPFCPGVRSGAGAYSAASRQARHHCDRVLQPLHARQQVEHGKGAIGHHNQLVCGQPAAYWPQRLAGPVRRLLVRTRSARVVLFGRRQHGQTSP